MRRFPFNVPSFASPAQILFFLVVGASTLTLPRRAAAGLDDSGVKKITVGSEIARGHAAVTQAYMHGDQVTMLSTAVAIDKIVTNAKATGEDTPGYLLGARYTEWTILLHLLEKPDPATDDATAIRDCRAMADQDYREFRGLQQELGVDDPGLVSAAGNTTPAPAVARLAAWQPYSGPAPSPAAPLFELVKASQARAMKAHPDLATAGSALNKKFVDRYKTLQAEKSPRLQEPDWPEKLAAECASAPETVANR